MEFKNLCESFGIQPGQVGADSYADKNSGLTQFVSRLYTKMLGRAAEAEGLNYWCEQYLSGVCTIEDIATNGFLHSAEFTNLGLNNEDYITRMYQTFLNRDPDPDGFAYWVEQLSTGAETRDTLVYGFSLSEEFGKIKAEYGL